MEVRTTLVSPNNGLEAGIDPQPPEYKSLPKQHKDKMETDFGPWMMVSRRRGRGGGHDGASGGAKRPRSHATHAITTNTSSDFPNATSLHAASARSPRGGTIFKGRGNHIGNRPQLMDPIIVMAQCVYCDETLSTI